VLILDARDLIRSRTSNPTITTNIRCQTTCSNIGLDFLSDEGAKFAREASTPVEREKKQIGVEIKDVTRRANYVRVFDLACASSTRFSVKEVIQPQVPLRLPCYDFAPVTTLAFGGLAP
jgi:hypothetical protein